MLILFGLISLLNYKRTHSTRYFLLAIIAFGALIQVKAYAGVLSLAALFIAGVWQAKGKNYHLIRTFALSLVVSFLLFFPLNKTSTSLLVFRPFWFLETMMGLTDRLNWPKFFQAMTAYKTGGIWFKAIPAYTLAFLIFWYGNMGTRFIWEFSAARWVGGGIKKISSTEVFLVAVILLGGLLPMFFL